MKKITKEDSEKKTKETNLNSKAIILSNLQKKTLLIKSKQKIVTLSIF